MTIKFKRIQSYLSGAGQDADMEEQLRDIPPKSVIQITQSGEWYTVSYNDE
jgi:hypothetical protein